MSARRTVYVLMANSMEHNAPLMVVLGKRAATRAKADILEFCRKAPEVDFGSDAWEKQLAKRDRYLRRYPWGADAFNCDISWSRVAVRWME